MGDEHAGHDVAYHGSQRGRQGADPLSSGRFDRGDLRAPDDRRGWKPRRGGVDDLDVSIPSAMRRACYHQHPIQGRSRRIGIPRDDKGGTVLSDTVLSDGAIGLRERNLFIGGAARLGECAERVVALHVQAEARQYRSAVLDLVG
jgi:hypothetical protein